MINITRVTADTILLRELEETRLLSILSEENIARIDRTDQGSKQDEQTE